MFDILRLVKNHIGIVSLWELGPTAFAGTENFVHRLGVAAEQEGHLVSCLSPATNTEYRGLKHINIPIDGMKSIDENQLRSFIESNGAESVIRLFSDSLMQVAQLHPEIDIFIINSPIFALFRTNKPVLMVLHDNPDEYSNYLGEKNANEFMNSFASNMDASVVTPSRYYSEIYGKLLKRKIGVIPHALDTKYLPRMRKDTSDQQLNIANKIEILLPSRLEPKQKGQDLALEAIAKLSTDLKNKINLTFTGLDVPYMNNKIMLMELASKNNIKLSIDNYDDIFPLQNNANLIMLPSRYESFGYAAQEALALGKMVVMSNIPTFLEIAQDAPNAYIFNSNDYLSLRDAIDKAIHSTTSNMPSQKWYERYDYSKWVKQYLDLLR